MAILRSPRARKGREEAMCPRIRELPGKMVEEIEPDEDDQHGRPRKRGAIVSNINFVSLQCAWQFSLVLHKTMRRT